MRNTGQSSKKSSTVDAEEVAEVMQDEHVAEVMRVRAFKDADYASIESFDQAFAMTTAAVGVVNVADELGNGFRIATEDDKMRMQGEPLIFMEWFTNDGDFGDFVSANVVQRAKDGAAIKWVINDGSTGIKTQLLDYEKRTGKNGGLFAPKGLRVSTYNIDAETGQPLSKTEVREYITSGRKTAPAHTFYIDTSA